VSFLQFQIKKLDYSIISSHFEHKRTFEPSAIDLPLTLVGLLQMGHINTTLAIDNGISFSMIPACLTVVVALA
tara:strand:- start:584 stop:802 length:219 start_codon:yes stop_codon:yes gene_type:complete